MSLCNSDGIVAPATKKLVSSLLQYRGFSCFVKEKVEFFGSYGSCY